MKDFLKYMLATITGLVLTAVLLFFVGMLIVVGIVAASDPEIEVKENSVMMLKLDGVLSERTVEKPFFLNFNQNDESVGLNDILSAIQKAKNSPNIKGIYIQNQGLKMAPASATAIRKALEDFKSSDKFIVAYADNYSQGMYYISSVADEVILNPIGSIDWRGLSAQPIFYKELLDKVGIEMQIFKVGTFKSAVEPYIRTSMSEANRLQLKELFTTIWEDIKEGVATSRNLSKERLDVLANEVITFNSAESYIKMGLVDTLMYKDEVLSYLKQKTNREADQSLRVLTVEDMKKVNSKIAKDKSGDIIAVYYAVGDIIDGNKKMQISGETVMSDLRKLRKDENVKAVVLRVNSPGGSAFASEKIWRELKLLQNEKPLIVSMGDYAASGGYYISTPADCIVAEPTTITGSIGVFGMIPNTEKLMHKVGLNFDVVKTNEHADFGAINRPISSSEGRMIQANVNKTYELFVKRCADGRDMRPTAIKKIAEGRVWSGIQAKELGLVDELGGLNEAIAIAQEKAEVAGYTLLTYPEKASIFDQILKSDSDEYISTQLKSFLGDYANALFWMKDVKDQDRIQTRIPFSLVIN
jgi:protease-4